MCSDQNKVMPSQEMWIKIDIVDKLDEGITALRRNKIKIAVLKNNSKVISVFENNCPHNRKLLISDDFEMDAGELTITCKYHGACFKIDTGEVIKAPFGVYPISSESFSILDFAFVK